MRLLTVAATVVAFLAVSALVARVIGAASTVRGEVTDAIKRQPSAGDGARILRIDGVAGFAVTGRTDTARVAWRSGDRLPVVQCVRVRRQGDPVSGYDVAVLRISEPIGREEECPA